MKALMDTHTFLWCTTDDEKLSPRAKEIFENIDNEIFFSVVSAWEIIIKFQLGKLILPTVPEIFIPEQIDINQLVVLPVTLFHAFATRELSGMHRDPFDRMLIAQSKVENIPLLSSDRRLGDYGAEVLW